MKKVFTIIFLAISVISIAKAQINGDYRSAKSGNWNALDTWEVYSSGTWNPAASLVSTRNYTVQSGHTVTLTASTSCNILKVENLAVLRAINNAGATTVYLRVGHLGTTNVTIQNDGLIGGAEDGTGGAFILETSNVAMGFKLTGSGICRVARLRILQNNLKDPVVEIDQDVTVTDATAPFTAYTNSSASVSSENFTITINEGKTVKILNPNAAFHMGSSSTTNSAGSYTYNINGTLDLSESIVTTHIIPFANNSSSNITVNVNGLLKLGSGLNLVNSSPSGNNDGKVTLNINDGGIVDATKTTTLTAGDNYFKLSGTGVLKRKVDNEDVIFPIGLQSASSANSVILNNTGTSSNFSVGLSNTFDISPSSTQIVNRKWDILSEDSGANVNLKLNWKANDQGAGFDAAQSVSLVKLNGANWGSVGTSIITGPDASDFFQAEISGVTNFGEFALQNSSTLPLNFTSFDVKLKNATISPEVTLNWTTQNEVNTENFIIERSIDGNSFTPIGTILSKNMSGTHNYTYVDHFPAPNTSYYRLKQVDKDGKFDYSDIKSINNNSLDLQLSIYPNPVSEIINIIHPIADHNSQINIFDLNGKLIISSAAKMGTSNTSIMVNEIVSNMYFVCFEKQDYKSALKFIKK